jgi:hypothetical protein
MRDIVERPRAYDSLRDTTSSDKAIRREWGPIYVESAEEIERVR